MRILSKIKSLESIYSVTGLISTEGSIIAAGTLIPPGMEVPNRKLMVGIPAKPIRDITDKEYAEIKDSALHYIAFSRKYKKFQKRK